MNNTFSFKRFSMLFSAYTAQHYKKYLLSILVLLGLLVAILGYSAYMSRGLLLITQSGFFTVMLFVSGCVFTSMIFADMGDKRKAIPSLMLPVSHFEKWLLAWIYSFVFFPLIFIACFYAVDIVVLNLCKLRPGDDVEILNILTYNDAIKDAISFMLLHAVTFLCAISFKKLHFIRAISISSFWLLAMIVVNRLMLAVLFDVNVSGFFLFDSVSIEGKYAIYMSKSWNMLLALGMFTIVGLLWVAAYFKLKEKEV